MIDQHRIIDETLTMVRQLRDRLPAQPDGALSHLIIAERHLGRVRDIVPRLADWPDIDHEPRVERGCPMD